MLRVRSENDDWYWLWQVWPSAGCFDDELLPIGTLDQKNVIVHICKLLQRFVLVALSNLSIYNKMQKYIMINDLSVLYFQLISDDVIRHHGGKKNPERVQLYPQQHQSKQLFEPIRVTADAVLSRISLFERCNSGSEGSCHKMKTRSNPRASLW